MMDEGVNNCPKLCGVIYGRHLTKFIKGDTRIHKSKDVQGKPLNVITFDVGQGDHIKWPLLYNKNKHNINILDFQTSNSAFDQ